MIRPKRRRQLQRCKPRNHEERLYDALLRLWEYWLNSPRSTGGTGATVAPVALTDSERRYIMGLLYGQPGLKYWPSIAASLTVMSKTLPQSGSLAKMLAIYANECMKKARV